MRSSAADSGGGRSRSVRRGRSCFSPSPAKLIQGRLVVWFGHTNSARIYLYSVDAAVVCRRDEVKTGQTTTAVRFIEWRETGFVELRLLCCWTGLHLRVHADIHQARSSGKCDERCDGRCKGRTWTMDDGYGKLTRSTNQETGKNRAKASIDRSMRLGYLA